MKASVSIPTSAIALLLVDLQEEYRHDARYMVEDYDVVLANARKILVSARSAAVPIIHAAYVRDFDKQPPRPLEPVTADGAPVFSNAGSPYTAICTEVSPTADEVCIAKNDESCFSDTDLEPILRKSEIEWLIICGVWTEACVAATVRDAIARGFRVLLVKDACGSGTSAMHQTAIINLANRLYGGAVIDSVGTCAVLDGGVVDAWRLQLPVPLRFQIENIEQIYADL